MEEKDIKKLVFIFALVLIIAIVCDCFQGQTDIQNVLFRNGLGEGERKEELWITIDGIEKEFEYSIDVEAILPTEEQAEKYFSIAKAEIDEDFLEIATYVPTKKTYAEGIVLAEWSFSPWTIVNAEGEISFDKVPEEGVTVSASVMLTCGEYEETYQFAFDVEPKIKKQEEMIFDALKKWVETELQKEGEEKVLLPTELEGSKISWTRKRESITLQILVLEIVALIVLVVFSRQAKATEAKKRNQNLEKDYPELVGQLALLTGAGMSIRQAWNTIATRYSNKRQKNLVREKEVFEGVVKMNRRITEGENEKIAYQTFANETKNHLYHRLMRLLIGNLEKGTRGMQEALAKESHQAYEQRILYAKKLGEEASTRMLVPLMMMLVIVMAIVMTPALLDFTR